MWTAWLSWPLPRLETRKTFLFPEETSMGAVPV